MKAEAITGLSGRIPLTCGRSARLKQKDPFNRSNITWRQYDDGTRFYGAYRLDRIEVDDSPMTDEEVRAHEDRMIDEVLATLPPEQRAAIEARMHPTRP